MHNGNTISPYAHPLFLAGLPGVLGILTGVICTASASVMARGYPLKTVSKIAMCREKLYHGKHEALQAR